MSFQRTLLTDRLHRIDALVELRIAFKRSQLTVYYTIFHFEAARKKQNSTIEIKMQKQSNLESYSNESCRENLSKT